MDRDQVGEVGTSSPDLESKLAELQRSGCCVLPRLFSAERIEACRSAFWPALLNYLQRFRDNPNRGPDRHFLAMPFAPPCFSPEFFFHPAVLTLVRGAMDDRVVADQWGCDVAVLGSEYQQPHADFQRPLFAEAADLLLPTYMLVISFALNPIESADGPIEIAPGTHRLPRQRALYAVSTGNLVLQPVPLALGDVLIRHPWALHRGSPNLTQRPRALLSIRYVRRWYTDSSREVNAIPAALWQTLAPQQQQMLRFPIIAD